MKTVLDKRVKGKLTPGYTDNVYRYKYNGKYIDLEHVSEGYKTIYKIISYG